jgi:hypothetical protein
MSATLPVRLQLPPIEHRSPGFQKGHPRYGGRRKGTRDRFSCDLREEIVAAIQETGFVGKDDQGNPIATGEGGCKGFIKWLALHEPKTAAALLARVLPYFVGVSEVPEVASEAGSPKGFRARCYCWTSQAQHQFFQRRKINRRCRHRAGRANDLAIGAPRAVLIAAGDVDQLVGPRPQLVANVGGGLIGARAEPRREAWQDAGAVSYDEKPGIQAIA